MWDCGVTNVSVHTLAVERILIGGGIGHTPVQTQMINALKLLRRKEQRKSSLEIASVQSKALEETFLLISMRDAVQQPEISD